MSIKIAINGFGRIGRTAFRQLCDMQGFDVVAINDLTSPEMLAHLVKYDSSQRRFNYSESVSHTDNAILVKGVTIPIFDSPDPARLPWQKLDVDIVLECTGFFNSRDKAAAHIEAGAKKVIVSAPAGDDLPTIVYGVNHTTLSPGTTIISTASCTTNCLAPLADNLNKLTPIEKGYMTTIHAYTADQMLQDGPHRKGNLRRARAAACNIVPNSTGAAKAIGLVLPELNGRLDGNAQRVPVSAGSLTELTAVCSKVVSVEEVNAAMKAAACESFGYTEDQIVSSDIIGTTQGGIFDATQTRVTLLQDGLLCLIKVAAWYDNEFGYVAQMLRTARHFASLT